MDMVIAGVEADRDMPTSTDVVVIGGGIIGVCTALFLAQKGIPVVLCEKGEIAHEQSGRNWGWVRVMGRDPAEIPLSLESQRLWSQMNELTGEETGFRRAGIVYTCDDQKAVQDYEEWLEHARPYQIDSRLLGPNEIESVLPGVARQFAGALYTPNDARAEPQLAVPAMAKGAQRLGATILTRCAVRGLETSAGRISGVVTERGRIGCRAVVLAGGAWSRLFCGNHGIDFPALKVLGSVLRTKPLEGPPTVATGGSDYAFRKRLDGGYSIAQRGATMAEIIPDSFRLFGDFFPSLIKQRHELRLRIGQRFIEEWKLPRRWRMDEVSPFEKVRTLDPEPVGSILAEAKANLTKAFPAFAGMEEAGRWAGLIDVTPDAVPVMSELDTLPGFFLAAGFSGHGFGIGPGAGRMMADLVAGETPIIDHRPYTHKRFPRLANSKPH